MPLAAPAAGLGPLPLGQQLLEQLEKEEPQPSPHRQMWTPLLWSLPCLRQMPAAPGAPGAMEGPQAPGAMEGPQAPGAMEGPQAPGAMEWPGAPGAMEGPQEA